MVKLDGGEIVEVDELGRGELEATEVADDPVSIRASSSSDRVVGLVTSTIRSTKLNRRA